MILSFFLYINVLPQTYSIIVSSKFKLVGKEDGVTSNSSPVKNSNVPRDHNNVLVRMIFQRLI